MKRKRQSWLFQIIAVIIGIALLFALIYYAGFEQFLDILLQTSPYWIVIAVIVYAVSWIFRTWRLRRFTSHAGKDIKLFDLFKLYISGYALNTIFPAKLGDVATVGYLKAKGINIGKSAAIIIQTRILDILALILLSIPALTLFFQKGTFGWVRTSIIISILVVAVPISIATLDRNKSFSGILERFGNKCRYNTLKLVVAKTRDAYDGYLEIIANRTLLVFSILLSIIIWLFDGLTCYAVSISVGAHISVIVVILAVTIANIGKSVPATPGSIGIYEGILAAVLVLFGVSPDIAVAIAILDHIVKKLFVLTIGLPATTNIGFNIFDLKAKKWKK